MLGGSEVVKIDIGECVIRDWSKDDAVALAKHANNPKISANLRDRFPCPYALSDAQSFLSFVASHHPRVHFALATKTEAIGGIGIEIGEDVHRLTAELGYWLAEPYWGRGIATSAVLAITEYCFQYFSLKRIYAESYSTNLASHRVLEKAGFVLEGTMRANVIKKGKVLDQRLYAMVRDEVIT